MVESGWVKNKGQFLYPLDPDVRKITKRLERLHLKIINKKYSEVFNKASLNN